MSCIRIARHGETTWNAIGRYQGRLETPLSDLGRAQARLLAVALAGKGIKRIISSPLSRCVETAKPLAELTGLPIETDPLLLEIAHGTWQGRYRDEIAASEPALFARWRERPEGVRFEGGESLNDVLERWRQFVARFDPAVDTLLMTHDVVVRIAVLERTGRPLHDLRRIRALNAAYAMFAIEQGEWTLQEECVSDHLAALTADLDRQAL